MKFKLVKEVKGAVKTYGGWKMRTGEVVEIKDEHLIKKADNNPEYERVANNAKITARRIDPDHVPAKPDELPEPDEKGAVEIEDVFDVEDESGD
jgi:hypothetical protein